jgi:hypothetical protein
MEILVSLIIITTLSLGLCGIFIMAQTGTSAGDDKIVAAQIAEKALSELKAVSFADFKNWAAGSNIPISDWPLVSKNSTTMKVTELRNGTLTVTVGAFPVSLTPPEYDVTAPEYKELTAQVNWTSTSGIVKSVNVATGIYKASNG